MKGGLKHTAYQSVHFTWPSQLLTLSQLHTVALLNVCKHFIKWWWQLLLLHCVEHTWI